MFIFSKYMLSYRLKLQKTEVFINIDLYKKLAATNTKGLLLI